MIENERFKDLRERYNYNASDLECTLEPTDMVARQLIQGVHSKNVIGNGINLRLFEDIVQKVFLDFSIANKNGHVTNIHRSNLKEIVKAIVYWKMSSQGGRAVRHSTNVINKWTDNTEIKLMHGYMQKEFKMFKIDGVRIPTASSLIRFIYPEEYGIIDSRVVGKYTQPNGITTLKLRRDGYIIDTLGNTKKYISEYNYFLKEKASELNKLGLTFDDVDQFGVKMTSEYRPCDVEMALFSI